MDVTGYRLFHLAGPSRGREPSGLALNVHSEPGAVSLIRLVLRQLQSDLVRTLLTCLGIGAVIGVILVLEGFEQGIYAQLRNTVLDRGGALIATQAGVSNMTAARSVIPQMAREQVEAVDQVRIAHPMTALPVIYEKEGRKSPLFLMVTDTLGGPRELVAGHQNQGPRDIVVDRSFAEKHRLRPGDDVVIADFTFKLAGISDNTAALFTALAFVKYDSLIDFYFESDLAEDISAFPLLSYLIIEIEPGADPSAVAERIEQTVESVDVHRPEVIAEHDAELGESIIGAIMKALIVIGYLAGVLVVGLFMFAATSARRSDLGVLKAIGFRDRALVQAALLEALLVTVAAIPLGIGMAYGVAAAVHAAAPVYLLLPTEAAPLLRTIVACLGFAVVGALAPVRLIKNLEPAMVFQS